MQLLIGSALPLALGGAIYVVWRPSTIVLNRLVAAAGVAPAAPAYWPGNLVVYSLPNALWLLSLLVLLARIWRGRPAGFIGWSLVAVGMALGSELGQLLGILPGTFDGRDVGCIALAGAVGLATFRREA